MKLAILAYVEEPLMDSDLLVIYEMTFWEMTSWACRARNMSQRVYFGAPFGSVGSHCVTPIIKQLKFTFFIDVMCTSCAWR